jgi:hypothetical protein
MTKMWREREENEKGLKKLESVVEEAASLHAFEPVWQSECRIKATELQLLARRSEFGIDTQTKLDAGPPAEIACAKMA